MPNKLQERREERIQGRGRFGGQHLELEAIGRTGQGSPEYRASIEVAYNDLAGLGCRCTMTSGKQRVTDGGYSRYCEVSCHRVPSRTDV